MKRHIAFVRRLIILLDTKYSVFGVRFGIDPVLDIIPGFGSAFGTLLSCYVFWIAYMVKAPTRVYLHMLWNITLDYLIGLIPFIGLIFDVFHHSNIKNFALLEPYIEPEVLVGELVEES